MFTPGRNGSSDRAIGALATLCVVIALAVHVLAIAGVTPVSLFALIPVFVIGILLFGATLQAVKTRVAGSTSPFAAIAELFGRIPIWGRVLIGVSLVYVGVNFIAFLVATGGGTIEQASNGGFVLRDHGRLIRVLDESGVREVETWQLRLFSGHILPFLLLPALYFGFSKPRESA